MKCILSTRISCGFSLVILLLPLAMKAQPDPWSGWDTDVVRSLKRAGDAEYLNEDEKQVILLMNMARYNGLLFAQTFLERYLEDKQLDNTSYIRSLKRELNRTSRLPPLIPEKDLTAVAQAHATRSGEAGTTGHAGFNDRFGPLMGNPYNHVGENCSYGYEKAIDIVISLLIDEGITNLGHRKNILSPGFNSTGVAIRPHKTYRVNCVIDFGSRARSSTNELHL